MSCIKLGVGLLMLDNLTVALHVFIAPVVTTTSVILTSSKIQNGNVLVLAYPGCPGNGL